MTKTNRQDLGVYEKYILEMTKIMGAKDDNQTRQQIIDMLNLETELNQVNRYLINKFIDFSIALLSV